MEHWRCEQAGEVKKNVAKKLIKSTEIWKRPAEDLIRLHCDASIDSCFGKASSGVVERNSDGRLLDSVAKKVFSNNVAIVEALALREVILLARGKSWKDVVLETDAESIFEGLKKC